MTRRFARGNRDANEKPITEYLRRANVRHFLLPEGFGSDILLLLSPMQFVEVKNPNVPLSDRQLTDKEKEIQAYCHEIGIPYWIVETPEEMAFIINSYIENKEA